MDPTLILYALMIVKGAQNARDDERRKEDERELRDERANSDSFWKSFHDDMDRTFKRGRYRRRR